jgi:phage-related protein
VKRIVARFYKLKTGTEPVRQWLRGLNKADRKEIGTDIAAVEFGWPLGLPVCRPLGKGLHEVRSNLPDKRIARTMFVIVGGEMILLHGFIKKTKKTPKADLDLARSRKARLNE